MMSRTFSRSHACRSTGLIAATIQTATQMAAMIPMNLFWLACKVLSWSRMFHKPNAVCQRSAQLFFLQTETQSARIQTTIGTGTNQPPDWCALSHSLSFAERVVGAKGTRNSSDIGARAPHRHRGKRRQTLSRVYAVGDAFACLGVAATPRRLFRKHDRRCGSPSRPPAQPCYDSHRRLRV